MAFDSNMVLSSNYNLADLCVTSQILMQPNIPSDQSTINNLIVTADVLEQLTSTIGPFSVLSGFRTKELQQVLGEAGNPVAQGLSFHEVGRAVDIYPTTMALSTLQFLDGKLDQAWSEFNSSCCQCSRRYSNTKNNWSRLKFQHLSNP